MPRSRRMVEAQQLEKVVKGKAAAAHA
jgi:hypothetical protein